MPIKIDHCLAKKILVTQAHNAEPPLDDLATTWKKKIDALGELCPYRKSSTFIAALGTAILAKSVNKNIDVYSLLDRDGGERSYSARSLADGVWAKNRAYLGIDLGANNANPLNNTPFVGRARIDGIENVRNKEGLKHLYHCLEELDKISNTSDAKAALRGFISSRKINSTPTFQVGKNAGDHLVELSLSQIITTFVSEDSEEGRRAQATAAGLLSIAFPKEHITVSHINDPDRHSALDINVFRDKAKKDVIFCMEVKDKPITGPEILASAEKAIKFGITNVIYLAIAKKQKQIDFLKEQERARDLGCKVVTFQDWAGFVKACLLFSTNSGPKAVGEAYKAIGSYLPLLGVSQPGIDNWITLGSLKNTPKGI